VPLFKTKNIRTDTFSNIMVEQYVSNQTTGAPAVLRCWPNNDHNAFSPPERNAVLLLEIHFHQ